MGDVLLPSSTWFWSSEGGWEDGKTCPFKEAGLER